MRSFRRPGPSYGLLFILLLALGQAADSATTGAQPPTAAEQAFLDRHWASPIPPQGPPPAGFTPIEVSLRPRSCGTCHPAQLADWKSSLHAASMAPGVTGQLVEMERSDPETARSCLGCHAPLAEQQPPVAGASGAAPGPGFDPQLQAEGLVCAACHVRRHERFGPPRPEGLPAASRVTRPPHGGATRTSAFRRSEFCSVCHQFGPDGYALNGKLLENTFGEWKASPAARLGLHCQDCHMPDRRHLWRGIHDRDMVRSALEISLGLDRPRVPPGEQLVARLTVTSVNVGHYFPTYVTPRVVVRMELFDPAGRTVLRTREEHVIGRQVSLDLSRELSDTRIPPGGQAAFEYRRGIDRLGLRLRATVTVFPDHFYSGFFRSLLATGAGAGTAQIRRALESAERSSFEIFRREIPVS